MNPGYVTGIKIRQFRIKHCKVKASTIQMSKYSGAALCFNCRAIAGFKRANHSVSHCGIG